MAFNINFDNNHSGGEPVEVYFSAEEDNGAFLALSVTVGDDEVADAILTDPTAVKEFRDRVVQECDEFLRLANQ